MPSTSTSSLVTPPAAIPPLPPALHAAAARQGGVFTAAQAMECGFTRGEIASQLKSAAWVRLRRGVFIEAAVYGSLDLRARHVSALRAVLLKTAEPTIASHLTAAVVHGLPLLHAVPELIQVTVPGAVGTRMLAGVKHYGSTVPAHERAVIDGVACTTLARTVVDVARSSSFAEGVVVADAALQRGLARADIDAAAARCLNWPRARQMSRVLAFAQLGAESVGESVARMSFAREGLPAPRLQVQVFDRRGLIGRADFLWDEFATIGEFDGRVKYAGPGTGPQTLYAEKQREDRLRDAGFEVVRFGWSELQREADVIAARVRAAFARHRRRCAG